MYWDSYLHLTSAHDTSPSSDDWWKYCLLLGKPGTRKSQVVVRAFHHAIQQECAVLLATPVALQSHLWPRSTCQEHSHGFPNSIWPGAGSRHQLCPQPFRHGGPWWGIPHLTAYLLLGGQHSKSSELLSCCADSWGQAICSNHCRRWTAGSPTPCPSSMMAPSTTTTPWSTPYTSSSECSIQTTAPSWISSAACSPPKIQSPGRWGDLSLQPVGGNIGHDHLTHCSATGQQHHGGQTVQGPTTPQPGPLLCSRHENHHHQKLRQELQDCEWTGCNLHPQPRDSLVIQFPDNERAFLYPVTHAVEGESNITRNPFTPAYARTICKSQGQNLKHLLLWLDCPTVPPGLTFIALSPVRKKVDLTVLQLMDTSQLMPVGCRPDQHWIHSLSLVSSIHLFDGALFSFPCMQATGCSANA